MNLGFNSKIEVGAGLYHVQTEDRGLMHPFIDTVVLLQGQVLHRRSTSYQDLVAAGAADQTALHARVEQQHRDVLEGLRAGSLALDVVAPAKVDSLPAVGIRLRNSTSWLSSGHANLEIEVCDRANGRPLSGAEVEVAVEGAVPESAAFTARTDVDGVALVRFLLPQLQHPEAAVLVIGARVGQMHDQIRYHLKPKTHDSGSDAR